MWPLWRWHDLPFTRTTCCGTAACTISTYSPGFAPPNVNLYWSVTLPFFPFGAVIHCAPERSASGRVSGAGPIHFAFQSDGFTTPIVNSAGSDQSLSLP